MKAFIRNMAIGLLATGIASGAIFSVPSMDKSIDKVESNLYDRIESGEYVRTATLDLTVETLEITRDVTSEVNGVMVVVGTEIVWQAQLVGTQRVDVENPAGISANEIAALWTWNEEKLFDPGTKNPYLDCFTAIVDNFPAEVPEELTSPLDGCIPEPNSLLFGLLGSTLLLIRKKQ